MGMRHLAILCMQVVFVYALSCNDIRDFPSNKKLTQHDLQSIHPKDMMECLAHLGKEKLSTENADFIWRTIVAYYNGTANIPDNILMTLHWITTAVTPEDYANITLNNIDVIQNFGLNYELNDAQLSAIADRVRDDFAGKEPEDYTYYDLLALRQILCAFNQSEIEKIRPAAFREAASIIGKLERCRLEVMAGFGTLAVKEDAFGAPNMWSKSTVKILGKVAEILMKKQNNKNLTLSTT